MLRWLLDTWHFGSLLRILDRSKTFGYGWSGTVLTLSYYFREIFHGIRSRHISSRLRGISHASLVEDAVYCLGHISGVSSEFLMLIHCGVRSLIYAAKLLIMFGLREDLSFPQFLIQLVTLILETWLWVLHHQGLSCIEMSLFVELWEEMLLWGYLGDFIALSILQR